MTRVIHENKTYPTSSEVRSADRDDVINGCKLCGIDADMHACRWHAIYGTHLWQEPSNEQRKSRYKKRLAGA